MITSLVRFLFLSLLYSLMLPAFGQTANQATLTLVTEDGFNEANIELNVDLIGSSNDTSELSGTIEVQLNILPGQNAVDELSILSADVNGSSSMPQTDNLMPPSTR